MEEINQFDFWAQIWTFIYKMMPTALIGLSMVVVKLAIQRKMGKIIGRWEVFFSCVIGFILCIVAGYMWENSFGTKYAVPVSGATALMGEQALLFVFTRSDDIFSSALAKLGLPVKKKRNAKTQHQTPR